MVFRMFGGRQKPPEEKMNIQTGVIGMGSGTAQWTARHPVSMLRMGYMQNPIAFRSVRMISEAAAQINFHLQDESVRYDTHPVLNVLERPNETQSRIAFFEELYGYYLLLGQAYVLASFDEQSQIAGLHLLRPDRVKILVGADGWPRGYEYTTGAHKTIYEVNGMKSQVLQIKSFHPQDDHYGLPPTAASANAVDVHNAAGAWSKALLDNAARPSGAIVYRGIDGFGSLTPTQFERLRDEIENHHQGARNAGRPMLLEGGLDWKPMGFSPSDMEFHRTKDTAAREIALAFGVPPMLLGIPGDNTYSNYQEANRAFYRVTILPLVERVVSSLNGWLLEGEVASLKVDQESITALAFERESDWRRIASADFLTRNEKRKLLGFPHIEEAPDEGV